MYALMYYEEIKIIYIWIGTMIKQLKSGRALNVGIASCTAQAGCCSLTVVIRYAV